MLKTQNHLITIINVYFTTIEKLEQRVHELEYELIYLMLQSKESRIHIIIVLLIDQIKSYNN